MTRHACLRASAALFVLGGALVAPLAQAHNLWLLPSITVLSDTKQKVTVDAGASTRAFEPNHAAIGTDGVSVIAPDGSAGKIENAARLANRSVFDVAIDKEGTWRIGISNEGMSGRFKVNGEDWMLGRRRGPPPGATPPAGAGAPAAPAAGAPGAPGGRPRFDPSHIVAEVDQIPAGATDLDLAETQSTNEFFVTAGAPTTTTFTPKGKGLEFVPETLPTDLVAGEPARFRFLIDGKPASGLKVEALPGPGRFFAAEDSLEATTDAQGGVSLPFAKPGLYWLHVEAEDAKPSDSRAQKRRMSYTATLEVLAP